MNFHKIFSLIGFLGVACGAFGSHALKKLVSTESIEVWKTATLYLFVHALVGLYSCRNTLRNRSSYFFLFGIILFSGSLFLLSVTSIKFFGFITPVGGVFFLLGWLSLYFDHKETLK